MSEQPEVSPTADVTARNRGADTPLGALKQIDTAPLGVGYAEAGPADGATATLLHGWPYDIHTATDR